jgi:hypothetical protein
MTLKAKRILAEKIQPKIIELIRVIIINTKKNLQQARIIKDKVNT